MTENSEWGFACRLPADEDGAGDARARKWSP